MFHRNVDMTAVLLYRMSDTPQPESVISLSFFGCPEVLRETAVLPPPGLLTVITRN